MRYSNTVVKIRQGKLPANLYYFIGEDGKDQLLTAREGYKRKQKLRSLAPAGVVFLDAKVVEADDEYYYLNQLTKTSQGEA